MNPAINLRLLFYLEKLKLDVKEAGNVYHFLFGFQTCVDWCLKQLPCQLVLEAIALPTVPEPLHFGMKYS